MHYRIIDMASDPRSGQFAYFRGMTFPFAGLTVEMDITDMMAARGGRPPNMEKSVATSIRLPAPSTSTAHQTTPCPLKSAPPFLTLLP